MEQEKHIKAGQNEIILFVGEDGQMHVEEVVIDDTGEEVLQLG